MIVVFSSFGSKHAKRRNRINRPPVSKVEKIEAFSILKSDGIKITKISLF